MRQEDTAGKRLRLRDHDHHGHLTPMGALAEHPKALAALTVTLVVVATIAAVDHGALYDHWDVPIQEWVERSRTSGLETFFRGVSRLGSNIVIFPLAAIAAAAAWPRCRPLSGAVVGAVALRPAFEFIIKDVVGRPRPDFDRLVNGVGYSHPSGHVLATVTLYSLLPAVIALYLGRKRVWWLTWGFVAALAPLMAACRVYLGVHWVTDATAGLLWGVAYVAGVEFVFYRFHAGRCGHFSDDWRDHEGHPHHLRLHDAREPETSDAGR